MVGRNNFTIGMLKTMYDYFFEVYDQKDTVYDKIFKEEPSDAAFEQSTTVVGMGKLLLKPENEPIIYRQPQEGYTTYGINNTFADGIEISMEAVDDHQRIDNLVRAAAQTWAEAVRWTKEKFYADTFNLGGKTAGDATFRNVIAGVLEQNADGLQYDGKPLINLSICPCGYRVLHDSISLGTVYTLSDDIRGGWTYRCGRCGQTQRNVTVVMAAQKNGAGVAALPLALFVGTHTVPDVKDENDLRLN